jgi:hypothetical protein
MDFTSVFEASGVQLFVFVILEYPSRKIIQIGVTENPNRFWLIQQFRNCAISNHTFPKAMIHDRDGIYGRWLPKILLEFGMKSIRTQVRSPWQNCYVERVNLSIKKEVLNRLIIVDESHARELCVAYQDFYNSYRLLPGEDELGNSSMVTLNIETEESKVIIPPGLFVFKRFSKNNDSAKFLFSAQRTRDSALIQGSLEIGSSPIENDSQVETLNVKLPEVTELIPLRN